MTQWNSESWVAYCDHFWGSRCQIPQEIKRWS